MGMEKIIAVDQSTSSTKAMLFNSKCQMVDRCNVDHKQYYPQAGWVEHDAQEIYSNTVEAIKRLVERDPTGHFSLAITNQRETVVVWDKRTGIPPLLSCYY